MSAQKTAFVCLILLMAFQAAVQLLPRSSAVVVVRRHRVELNICFGLDRNESCTLALKVY